MFGVVDLDHKQTKVTVGGVKIEIQFRKKQLMKWNALQTGETDIELVTTSLEPEEEEGEKIEEIIDDDGDESSDLDDYCHKAEPKSTIKFDSSDIDDYL